MLFTMRVRIFAAVGTQYICSLAYRFFMIFPNQFDFVWNNSLLEERFTIVGLKGRESLRHALLIRSCLVIAQAFFKKKRLGNFIDCSARGSYSTCISAITITLESLGNRFTNLHRKRSRFKIELKR